jgi:hypothetical protein
VFWPSASCSSKSLLATSKVAVTSVESSSTSSWQPLGMYAIRLLNSPVRPPRVIQRRRAPQYGAAVQDALMVVWRAANGICSKRLMPFLPELVPILERHGHLSVDDGVRAQLLSMSAATADRMVRRLRETDRPHGISTTKPGRLLKRQVPVRTFGEWDDLRPGFFEADLVAHCGGSTDGSFLYTLCLTDVATGWTECLPLLHRIPSEAVQARLAAPYSALYCCSIWTASKRSTTHWGTRLATACFSRSANDYKAPCWRPTWSLTLATTNSRFCSLGSTPRRPRRWPRILYGSS